jgi:hypothetical protein
LADFTIMVEDKARSVLNSIIIIGLECFDHAPYRNKKPDKEQLTMSYPGPIKGTVAPA